MTQEQNEQLIKELEKRLESVKDQERKSFNDEYISFCKGCIYELNHCIKLLNQTTVNRSSTEPKFIEE